MKKPITPKDNRFTGSLYVLQDGGSFSTTGHLLSLIKYHQLGVIVGDTSGGSFRCNGCYNDLILPNSKLNLMYSRCTYQTAVKGYGLEAGVPPDIYFKPDVFDLIENRDIVVEKVISILSQDEK